MYKEILNTGIILYFILCISVSYVTGIRFDITSSEVELSTHQDTDLFWLNCTVERLSNEALAIFLVKIQRASTDGHTMETIATLTSNGPDSESSAPSYWRRPELLQGFLYTNESRLQSYLNVGVRVSGLTCVDSRMYNCEVAYVKNNPVLSVTESLNTSLTMTARPSMPSLAAMHVNTRAVFDTISNSADLPASLEKYETLEITCTADIGTDRSRSLQWAKSSDGLGDTMIDYSTDVVEQESTPITSGGAASSCRYQRFSRMRYNTTYNDANRGSGNALRFSCMVSASQNSVMFYINVVGGSTTVTDSPISSTDEGLTTVIESHISSTGSNIGAVIGGVIGGIVIGAVSATVVMVYLRRNKHNNGQKDTVNSTRHQEDANVRHQGEANETFEDPGYYNIGRNAQQPSQDNNDATYYNEGSVTVYETLNQENRDAATYSSLEDSTQTNYNPGLVNKDYVNLQLH